MTVGELKKKLRNFPNDAEVFQVKDIDDLDEDGNYLDLYRIADVIKDPVFIDTGFGFDVETHVLILFESSKAEPKFD